MAEENARASEIENGENSALRLSDENVTLRRCGLLWKDQLKEALKDGDLDALASILSRTQSLGLFWYGAPLNATPLELACWLTAGAEFVSALLAAGANPNLQNPISKQYPLHLVCGMGDSEKLSALLGHVITLNVRDREGNTPLHEVLLIANRHGGHRACLDILLARRDVDVNAVNMKGMTPLHIALDKDNGEAVQKIMKLRGSDVKLNIKEKRNKPSLRELLQVRYPKEIHQRAVAGRLTLRVAQNSEH